MDEPFWGEVRMFAFHFAPRNWAHCNGQLLPISQNTTLFTLLGTTYGGDGRVTFALPDLRGRVPINAGNVYTIGERAGEATHTLIASELPAHTHTVNGTSAAADQTSPEGNLPAQAAAEIYNGSLAALTSLDASSVASAGGSQAHSNMQPFLTVSFCIAMSGQFPPR
ncbi:MAG: phage tail protein [Chloroflexi bacterium]|nr:MAG: phage tail protein [Chloroflexota bacterium]